MSFVGISQRPDHTYIYISTDIHKNDLCATDKCEISDDRRVFLGKPYTINPNIEFNLILLAHSIIKFIKFLHSLHKTYQA